MASPRRRKARRAARRGDAPKIEDQVVQIIEEPAAEEPAAELVYELQTRETPIG